MKKEYAERVFSFPAVLVRGCLCVFCSISSTLQLSSVCTSLALLCSQNCHRCDSSFPGFRNVSPSGPTDGTGWGLGRGPVCSGCFRRNEWGWREMMPPPPPNFPSKSLNLKMTASRVDVLHGVYMGSSWMWSQTREGTVTAEAEVSDFKDCVVLIRRWSLEYITPSSLKSK